MCVIQAGGNILVEIVIDADRQVVLASSCHVAAEVIQIGVIIAAGEQDRVGLFRHDRYGKNGRRGIPGHLQHGRRGDPDQ